MTATVLVLNPRSAADLEVERAVLGDVARLEPLVTDDLAAAPEGVLERADAVLAFRVHVPVTAAAVRRLVRCRLFAQATVGFNHIDLPAAAAAGIPVCNVPDYGTTDVADHAIALMLALVRGLDPYDRALAAGPAGWAPMRPGLMRRLRGAVFGVVGLGRIGHAAARRARAFEMDVVFHDPALSAGTELSVGFRRHRRLHDLLAEADVVSLHAPLEAGTERLIDAAAVAAMKPGAILVNTARGPILDLDAVEAGLRAGRIGGLGLDVFPVEPMPAPGARHPLLEAWAAREAWLDGRMIATPHAAFYTPESLADMRRLGAETVRQFLVDGTLRSPVNAHLMARNA